ncbi:hypothetical protein, partial [Streptococcus agalactiae]|uniref:hypothetical protein n=1 Tax=Streptococcus agalactiae TaxID=1311 RepID=UPI003F6D404E
LGDWLSLVGEARFLVALYLVCGHILTAPVSVRVCLHIALVEELVERLRTRQITKVKEHFVPKASVKQVKHGVFHAAHIQVSSARGTI